MSLADRMEVERVLTKLDELYVSDADSASDSQAGPEVGEKEKAPRGRKGHKGKLDFKLTAILKEDTRQLWDKDHKMWVTKQLWCVAINIYKTRNGATLFATVGPNRVTIYESFRNGDVKVLKCFEDPDEKEEYCSCAWGWDNKNKKPILAAAGESGTVVLICPYKKVVLRRFTGHLGQRINEIKFHPTIPELLLTASQDRLLRIFNIKNAWLAEPPPEEELDMDNITVAIFGGLFGHLDEVLSCDFNMMGDKMMSSSMDHSVNIWSTGSQDFIKKVEESQTYDSKQNLEAFESLHVHFPLMTTKEIHNNYVDCCRFFGDFVLSKTVDDFIAMWQPEGGIEDLENITEFNHCEGKFKKKPVTKVSMHDCQFQFTNHKNVWFMKFGVDLGLTTLAVGNHKGITYVWNLDVNYDGQMRANKLTHPL